MLCSAGERKQEKPEIRYRILSGCRSNYYRSASVVEGDGKNPEAKDAVPAESGNGILLSPRVYCYTDRPLANGIFTWHPLCTQGQTYTKRKRLKKPTFYLEIQQKSAIMFVIHFAAVHAEDS